MKQLLTLLLLLSAAIADAQYHKPDSSGLNKPVKDSSVYYNMQLRNMTRAVLDSLRKTESYQEIEEKLRNYRYPGNDYSSFVLFVDAAHTNFTDFNKSIAQDGFDAMDPVNPRIGFGVSMKSGWMMLDMYYVTIGTNSTSKKGDEKIKSALTSFLQVDLGYDLINSRSISLYPYVGLSLRGASLKYEKPDVLNPNYTNISNILVNRQSLDLSSLKVGYQAGMGFDVVVERSKNNATATILFVKGGTTGAIGPERYKFAGQRYEPGIKRADWNISFGVKFAGR